MNRYHTRRMQNLRGVGATNRHMEMRRRRREVRRVCGLAWPFRKPPVIEEIVERLDALWRVELLP